MASKKKTIPLVEKKSPGYIVRPDVPVRSPELGKEYWVFPVTYTVALCKKRFYTMFGREPETLFQMYGMIFAGPIKDNERPRERWIGV